ncbi:MAG: TetR/AcrR family transcriptional regulator [Deltaproteobacteria bacterium]|nr:TetR/AcrR family transcriptional regulator [Deltaproteobacteria bacterium]
MPRVVDREKKRDCLVQAASAVFATQGFSGTRMADIAARAGVGKGTVYEYFDSKEELFLAVFQWINMGIARRINDRLASKGSARAQLEAIFDESATIIADLRDVSSLNLDFWAACRGSAFEGRFKEALEALYDEYRGLVAGIIQGGQETGEFRKGLDPYSLAAALVGTFDGLGVQNWIDDSIDLASAASSFTTVVLSGLSVKKA